MLHEKLLSIILTKAPDFLLAMGLFVIFWLSGRILKAIVLKIMNEKSVHANISQILASVVKNIMIILGLITALGTLGVNISAIVAGLGLTSFAFGFAFKDMLSNLISGVLIFIYEPFKLGDTIEVEGKTGKVVEINLRYVTIEAENQKVLVPNSISVSKVISVFK